MTKKPEPDLPKYCFMRGRFIWVSYKDEHGKWVNKSTKYTIEQLEFARKYVRSLLRGVEIKRERGSSDPNTVKAYVKQWSKERALRGVASADADLAKLEKYAFPYVGDLALVEFRPRHARDMVRALRELRDEDGTRLLAPRTIHHIFNALHNAFENAIVDELYYGENPVKVKPGELPKKVDSDPEWRGQATYMVSEVYSLLTDPIIPLERRMQYALKALSGMRHGEVAALCWRHIEHTEPLDRIHIVQAWDSLESVIKSTKTEETRVVPVHPTLAKILAAWRYEHWERIYGRKPAADDFVVPTRTGRCVSAGDACEAFKRDLAALGLRVKAGRKRDRGGHDLRSWYETRCIEDGADTNLLRRTTHAPPKNVAGGYERFAWSALCREVAKLRFDILDASVMLVSAHSVQAENKAKSRWNVVTPKGLEPFQASRITHENTLSPDVHTRNRSEVITHEYYRRKGSLTKVATAKAMLHRALLDGDIPRALEVVAQIEE